MYIDKFFKEDGYYDKDDCFYETAEDFIRGSILGFCGCGMPDAALDYVRQVLRTVADLKEKVWEKKMTYEEWTAEKSKLFNSEGAEYFMWYFLDNKGLTEHGGSVPGWLTVEGEELLADLEELKRAEGE